jgi:uncharacterized membrane protein (DUF106 family)
MGYTLEDLKKKKVVELREIAAGLDHEAVKGFTQLNKEHLFQAVCTALGIDTHQHHIVKDVHKSVYKARIKELKEKRDAAHSAHDKAALHDTQKRISHLKRTLRKLAV